MPYPDTSGVPAGGSGVEAGGSGVSAGGSGVWAGASASALSVGISPVSLITCPLPGGENAELTVTASPPSGDCASR